MIAPGDEPLHPRGESLLAGVGQDLEPQPARARAAHFDDDADEGFLAVSAGDMAPLAAPADEGLVDLDLTPKGFTLRRHHRPAQLLQDEPRGLIARDPELALKLDRRDPGRVGGDQVGGPEPEPKRCPGAVHDRPRSDRGLLMAIRALPEVTALEHPGPPPGTGRAPKALRPA